VLVCEDAVCDRAERPAQVERAGRARGKTHTNHARTLPSAIVRGGTMGAAKVRAVWLFVGAMFVVLAVAATATGRTRVTGTPSARAVRGVRSAEDDGSAQGKANRRFRPRAGRPPGSTPP